MTRALITGIGGFTGRYVADVLARNGHEVHGIVHGPGSNVHEPIPGVAHLYQADVADPSSIEEVVQEVRPQWVAHLAAISFVGHADVEQVYRSNVVGTRQLLEALTRLSTRPSAILLASSANVYGDSQEGALDEAAPFAPANDYGVSKVAMEYVASLYSTRLPTIIVRPFNYTGRGQRTQFIIPKIVDHARRKASVIELGNVDVARDFSDVRAVAEIYYRLLAEPKALGGTFNVCSGSSVTLQEVLDIVGRLSGHHPEVRVNPAFVRANEVRLLKGSPARLANTIGTLPSIPIQATLQWMLEA